jgi:hypothetical protein
MLSFVKKDNIQRKLKNDFRARVVASNHITADIFGKDSGSIYEKGLIDSITEKEFDRSALHTRRPRGLDFNLLGGLCILKSNHQRLKKYST